METSNVLNDATDAFHGRVRIVERDGTAHEFGPGDSFVTHRGETLVWDVIEDVRKVFFTYNAGVQVRRGGPEE